MFSFGHSMTARRWVLASVLASATAWPIGRGAGRAEHLPQARYTEIYSSDSVDLTSPALSPDGKWVAFESRRQQDDKISLFIISTSGGKPRALTSSGYVDAWPVWFPGSDRIVFRSSRVDGGLMTLRIDTRTGSAIGEPRRLTIEAVQDHGGYSVSPDGKEILYPIAGKGQVSLKLVPANGGTARVVASMPGGAIPQSYWTSDGSIEFGVAQANGQNYDVMRSNGGGAPKLVQRIPVVSGVTWSGPDYLVRAAYVRINADTVGTLSVVAHTGDTVARFDSRGTTPPLNLRMRMGPRAGTFMLATIASREAVRGMSAAGGGPWTIRAPQTGYYFDSEWPELITKDSREVLLTSGRAASGSVQLVPLHGGAPRRLSVPRGTHAVAQSRSGRFLYTFGGHPRDTTYVINVFEAATGRTALVSPAGRSGGDALNLALPDSSDDFYYVEPKGARLELRRFAPGHGSTLVRSYARGPDRVSQELSVGAMAWAKNAGDSAHVYVDQGNDQPKEILAIRGAVRRVVWSRSGRSLAINTRTSMRGDSVGVAYIAFFDASGRMTGAPREVAAAPGRLSDLEWSPTNSTLAFLMQTVRETDTSLAAAYVAVNESRGATERARMIDLPRPAHRPQGLYWAPDGRTSFAHTLDRGGYRSQVWRVANEPNAKPVNISRESGAFWEMDVSPDGKTLVYQADLPSQSTIWRVEVPGLGTTVGR